MGGGVAVDTRHQRRRHLARDAREVDEQGEREERDAELGKLNLNLRSSRASSRMVSPDAFEAGNAAGASLAINPALRRA